MIKKFAQLLGGYVEASGMKQTRVASDASISYNYLQRLLAGDRNPSDQVVYKLAQALHLSAEQTGELLAAAGYAPPIALLQSTAAQAQTGTVLSVSTAETNPAARLAQQFYRLAQEVPAVLQAPFSEEMKHLLSYARYKYILSGGANLLELEKELSQSALTNVAHTIGQRDQTYLDQIAQLIGTLYAEPEEATTMNTAESSQPPQAVEDMLAAIDQLTGNILAGEVSTGNYQPQLIVQTLDLLREGAPWEIRRRIAEALPGLCRLDVLGAEHLMEALRQDTDEVRGVDIRRRVIEALSALIDVSPLSFPVAIGLLRTKPDDDIYVALATVETCGDLRAKAKQFHESDLISSKEDASSESLAALLQQSQTELAKIERQLLTTWEGTERESLQFSLALHNLLCAPDTLLLSLREGLQSPDRLAQWVAARYLERILLSRPLETLELYQLLLHTTVRRNVRRTVAKALPGLLQCLKEASLSTRALARVVISDLASDSDIYVRRAVADHTMQVFYIDREFLLILLRQMHKDTDQAIRHRLQPVALRLAQVWLIWYAETAGLVETKRRQTNATTPFGE